MISCSRGRELREEHVSEKIEWIVSLRAAAAIAVVLLHMTGGWLGTDWNNQVLEPYCYHRQYALPGAEGILCGLFAVCMGFRRGQTEFDWLLYVAGATAAVVFAANSRMMDKICQNRFTVLLEEISFPVYLLHQPLSASFCAILYIKMASKWGNGIAVNMGLAVCYFTALILLAWFWIKFVSKNLHVTEVHLLKLLTHNEKES